MSKRNAEHNAAAGLLLAAASLLVAIVGACAGIGFVVAVILTVVDRSITEDDMRARWIEARK